MNWNGLFYFSIKKLVWISIFSFILATNAVFAGQPWNLRDENGNFNKDFEKLTIKKIKENSDTYEIVTSDSSLLDQNNLRSKKPLLTEKWNIRDIKYNILRRDSACTSYLLHGNKDFYFDNSFAIENSRKTINGDLLQALHLLFKRQKDAFPNLATGNITFHYLKNNNHYTKSIDLNELYLAGAYHFPPKDQNYKEMKQKYKIITANEDLIDNEEEERRIHSTNPEIKGMRLGELIEDYLRKEIIGGPFKKNDLDSEAVLMLRLIRKFPTFLQNLLDENPGEEIEIIALFLGIQSYRDCCSTCVSLIHGFQHACKDILETIIKTIFTPNVISVHQNFGTYVQTYGQVSLEKGEFVRNNGKYDTSRKDQIWLKRGEHLLTRLWGSPLSPSKLEKSVSLPPPLPLEIGEIEEQVSSKEKLPNTNEVEKKDEEWQIVPKKGRKHTKEKR